MPDENIITPIGGPREGKKPAPQPGSPQPKRSLRRDMDGLVCLLAALTALSLFGLSVYFFYGFTQTDQGFWTLASAFGLCFGVGALAYVPCGYVSRTAFNAARGRSARKSFALALLLILPWVCVSLVFIGWSALPKVYGVLALVLSLVFCAWAFSRLARTPRV